MLTLNSIKERLNKRFEGEIISSLKSIPHPFTLKNLKEGAKLVAEAIAENQSILIVGDYDADGILSTSIMVQFFRLLGYANVSFVIPSRFKDGYGISVGILERFPEAQLIITVDNGITAIEVGDYCQKQGKTLIITDHHTPKDTLPQALIINPKVSGFVQEEICGALVAWYFCAGIKATLGLELSLTPFLELVGIAIISDVMPLKDLNRVILKKALSLFQSPSFPFSKLLIKQYKRIDEECIGFYIAPLLNASGRMDQTHIALAFLLSPNEEEAKIHFEALKALNTQRKAIQEEILSSIDEHIILAKECVVAYAEQWHEGVLGILAGKLAEHYQKPAFVLTLKNGIYQGSGRSFGQINLIQSLQSLNTVQEFGGHSGAVGLKINPDSIEDFAHTFTPIFEEEKSDDCYFGTLHPSLLTQDLLTLLQSFAPYGEGNPKPIFSTLPLPLLTQKHIGKDKNHTLLTFQTPFYKPIKALAFFRTELEVDFDTLRFQVVQDSFASTPMLLIQS